MKSRAKSLAFAGVGTLTALLVGMTVFTASAATEKPVPGDVIRPSQHTSPSPLDVSSATGAPEIRCYFRADVTTTYPAPNAPGITMPPYLLTGIEDVPGTDSHQTPDPVSLCARLWDRNSMNPGGITNDLIPAGFQQPVGNSGNNRNNQPGHYIPELDACAFENAVAVIPGAEACSRLGLSSVGKTMG